MLDRQLPLETKIGGRTHRLGVPSARHLMGLADLLAPERGTSGRSSPPCEMIPLRGWRRAANLRHPIPHPLHPPNLMQHPETAAPEARLVRALGVWGLAAGIVLVNIAQKPDTSPPGYPAAKSTAAAPAPSPSPSTPPLPGFPAKADYVGKISTANGTITLEITVEGQKAIAYACDGNTVESQLRTRESQLGLEIPLSTYNDLAGDSQIIRKLVHVPAYTAVRTAQSGSVRCVQSAKRHSSRSTRSSGKQRSTSAAGIPHIPTSRSPGVSTT